MNTEAIVYLLRRTSLTLLDIGELTPTQFNELLTELYYQEAVDEYRKQYSTASLLAAIYNTIPRKSGHKSLTAKDFLAGDMPIRGGKKIKNVDELAIKKGIKIPKE